VNVAALTGERGQLGPREREHIMRSTDTRQNTVIAAVIVRAAAIARRSQQMLIVLVLTLGAILLAPSMPAAHAGPGDGPDSQSPTPKPPLMHASENPVVFGPTQTTRYISVTAKPYAVTMRVIFKENGVLQGPGAIIGPGTPADLSAEIHYGKIYTSRFETIPENGMPKEAGPWLTITTVRPEIATTPDWGPPELVIPRRPGPPAPDDQGAAREDPGINRNPRTMDSPDNKTTP
jgi:hypothetical protein